MDTKSQKVTRVTPGTGQEDTGSEPVKDPEPPAKKKPATISFAKLYSRSSQVDKIMVVAGAICSFLNGCLAPGYAVVLGYTVFAFDPAMDPDERNEALKASMILSAIICSGQFVFGWASYSIMQIQAEKLAFGLRSVYLDALMRQETAYFEKQQVEALPSRISEYFLHIADGSGEKLSQVVTTLGMIGSGFAIAFARGPVFAAICAGYIPIYVGALFCFARRVGSGTQQKMAQNQELGSYTEEQMSAIKLVIAFGREDHALAQYEKMAANTRKLTTRSGI